MKEEERTEEEKEELGSWTKKMLKPENLIGPFESVEALMNYLDNED